MKLNAILKNYGIPPEEVSIITHTTNLWPWRMWLPHVAANQPELFAAYQSVHSDLAAATLSKRPYALSFVPVSDRLALSGLFDVMALGKRPVAEIYGDERFLVLESRYGATDTTLQKNAHRGEQPVFDLRPRPEMADLVGRLLIERPKGRRNYVHLAITLDPDVLAITEANVLTAPPPDWRDFVLTAAQLHDLPRDWASKLSEWRGVYLIVDKADGARYVGAAYGKENLLGRWRAHVSGDNGVTVDLGARPVDRFRFSILERLGPDAEPDQVIRAESSWKERLHTRRFGLNRN